MNPSDPRTAGNAPANKMKWGKRPAAQIGEAGWPANKIRWGKRPAAQIGEAGWPANKKNKMGEAASCANRGSRLAGQK